MVDRGNARVRATVVATAVVGVALAIAGIALNYELRHSMVSNIDQVTELAAADVSAAARRDGLAPIVNTDEDVVIQVVDSGGRVVAASADVAGRPRLFSAAPPARRTVRVPGRAGEYRLLATRARNLTVYVAANLKQADATVLTLRTDMFVAGPLLLALVALATWISTRRAVVPVLARLEQSLDQQRRFVGDASHELQTPLAAMRVDLEVALAHPDSTDWREVAGALLAETAQMERLVSDLLFIARSDDGAPRATMSPVDVYDVVGDEVERVRNGRIPVDATDVHAAFALARRDDIARVVRNLLDNAERHATSRVAITLRSQDGHAVLSVEDDGPGIPADERARVFERFARVDGARSRAGGGAGLGLAIVHDIVAAHGGTIRIEDGERHGMRVVVSLPTG